MWYSDFRQNGKRIRQALSIYRPKAELMLADLLEIRRSNKHGFAAKDISWALFKNRYQVYCKATKAKQTCYRDDLAFRMLESSLYIRKVRDLTPESLERVKQKWEKEGKTLAVVTRAIKSIKTAMRWAENMKYLGAQNWRMVKTMEPKGRLVSYTMDQFSKLLSVCNDLWFTGAMLMGRAGLRSGEVYHLTWSDIDFNLHAIHICAKPCDCYLCQGRWKPKGGKERWVPMVGDLERHLQSLLRHQGWVLGPDRPTLGSWQAYMARLIRKAHLPGSPHALRHTFASDLVSNGESLEVVGEILGHSNPKTTKIYSHLRPEALQNAIKKMSPLVSTLVPVNHSESSGTVPFSTANSDGKRRKRPKTVEV